MTIVNMVGGQGAIELNAVSFDKPVGYPNNSMFGLYYNSAKHTGDFIAGIVGGIGCEGYFYRNNSTNRYYLVAETGVHSFYNGSLGTATRTSATYVPSEDAIYVCADTSVAKLTVDNIEYVTDAFPEGTVVVADTDKVVSYRNNTYYMERYADGTWSSVEATDVTFSTAGWFIAVGETVFQFRVGSSGQPCGAISFADNDWTTTPFGSGVIRCVTKDDNGIMYCEDMTVKRVEASDITNIKTLYTFETLPDELAILAGNDDGLFYSYYSSGNKLSVVDLETSNIVTMNTSQNYSLPSDYNSVCGSYVVSNDGIVNITFTTSIINGMTNEGLLYLPKD